MAEEIKSGIRTISREEYAEIMALPVREFNFGGVQKRGRYDEATHKFYFMNDEGKLIGRIATVTFHDKAVAAPTVSVPGDTDSQLPAKVKRRASLGKALRKLAGSTEAKIDGSDRVAADYRTKKAPRGKAEKRELNAEEKRKRNLLTGSLLIVAMIFLCLIVVPSVIRNSVNGAAKSGSTAQSGQTEQGVPALDSISVIQVTRDLIPGDVLTSADLQAATISAADYNLIYTSNYPLYQWSRCEDLLQTRNYVTEYIPKGLYLTYDNVSAVYPQSVNPWIDGHSGLQYVAVPLSNDVISDPRLTYGALIDLVIQKSSQRSNVAQGENGDVDGMKISTIREDRTGYTLQDAVVCDLLNNDRESLYSQFSHFMAIPSGEQLTYLRNLFLSNPTAPEEMAPHFITIGLTEAQAKELGDLNSNNVSITITLTGRTDTGSDAKLRFAEGARVLLDNIALAVQRNDDITAEMEATNYAG